MDIKVGDKFKEKIRPLKLMDQTWVLKEIKGKICYLELQYWSNTIKPITMEDIERYFFKVGNY